MGYTLWCRLEGMFEGTNLERLACTASCQVGSGARSEKIRTYNWKDSRCSDHRIGKNFPLPSFLSGSGLDDMIGACILLDQQEMMAELAEKQRKGQETAASR